RRSSRRSKNGSWALGPGPWSVLRPESLVRGPSSWRPRTRDSDDGPKDDGPGTDQGPRPKDEERRRMQIRTVGVVGCGLMGSGIAQVSAASGYKTIVREVNDPLLQKGLGRIRKFLDAGIEKGKGTPEARDRTLANLTGTTAFDAFKDCDLVIEAIVENLDEKRATY